MRLARLLVVIGLAAAASPALGRPGGGQHYVAPARPPMRSGGSGPVHYMPSPVSSGGASTDESDVGGDSIVVVLLLVGVPATIVLLIVFAVARARRGRPGVMIDAAASARGIAALKERDPKFEPGAFVPRVGEVMAKVNDAWTGRAMAAARRYVSDGVYVRFSAQLALNAAAGKKNAMAGWRFLGGEIAAAESDPLWDSVHVRVAAEARDADVPLALEGEKLAAAVRAAPLARYEEVWSLIRRRGRTSGGAGALEGKCPSCGAAAPPAESVRCEYCQAVLNSGEHDWVLAEITQPEEWAPSGGGDPPGLEAIRARDPMVSRQSLEDRASVVFWKWVQARATGERGRFARYSAGPIDDAAAARLGLDPARLDEVAVGGAEVREARPGDGGEPDRVLVEIAWSASVDGGGARPERAELVLVRAQGAQTTRGVSSLDCPKCGGALADSDDAICRYCGEALAGGKAEWVLEAIGWMEAEEGAPDESGEEQ